MAAPDFHGVARSAAEREAGLRLRIEVFCAEQGVSREAELDGLDDEAVHIVGIEGGELVAVCRLLFEGAVCRLGRMAVARSRRRTGAGLRLMDAAIAAAREQGAGEIVLHAQRRAETFYASCGFRPEGDSFDEEGIPHVLMRLPIGERRDASLSAGGGGAE